MLGKKKNSTKQKKVCYIAIMITTIKTFKTIVLKQTDKQIYN